MAKTRITREEAIDEILDGLRGDLEDSDRLEEEWQKWFGGKLIDLRQDNGDYVYDDDGEPLCEIEEEEEEDTK